MDMNELLPLVEPELKSLEEFYTNLLKSRLLVIAGEFSDNEKESKATQEVIDSITAVITIDPLTVKLDYEYKLETWFSIMNEGMPAPDVTGGMAKNPDDTEYQSKAVITGGKFYEGAESPTYAYDEALQMAKSLMAEDIKTIITNSDLVKEKLTEFLAQKVNQTLGGDSS